MKVILAIHPKWAGEKIFSGEDYRIQKIFPANLLPAHEDFPVRDGTRPPRHRLLSLGRNEAIPGRRLDEADERQRKFLEEGCIAAEDLNAYQEPKAPLRLGKSSARKSSTHRRRSRISASTLPAKLGLPTKFDFDDFSKQLVKRN